MIGGASQCKQQTLHGDELTPEAADVPEIWDIGQEKRLDESYGKELALELENNGFWPVRQQEEFQGEVVCRKKNCRGVDSLSN
jgi:hypothetical protein